MNAYKIRIRLAGLLFAALFAAASIIGADAKETVLHGEPGSGRIKLCIGGYNAPLKGIFYVKDGTSLRKVLKVLSDRGAQYERGQMVAVYDSQNQRKQYRFSRMSKKELEAVVFHDGDRLEFPRMYF